jgi:hypothetical protein
MIYKIERIFEGAGHGQIQILCRNLPAVAKDNHRNPTTIITGVPAEIRTENLPNVNLERYRSILFPYE